MAKRYVRIGSMTNVHVYDDTDFLGGVETDDVIIAGTAPTSPTEVLRLQDVGSISGDVVGPASSTNNAIVRFDGITGKKIQNSLGTIDDSGRASLPSAKIGGATDYINIDSNGVLVFHGDARFHNHIAIPSPSWVLGGTAPTAGFLGVWPILSFSSGGPLEEVYYALMVPYRFDGIATMNMYIDWCYTGADDNGTVKWDVEYRSIEPGEVVDGAVTSISGTSAGNHTSDELVRTAIATGITCEPHDDLGIKLTRDSATDTLATNAHLIEVHLQFTTNRLGEPL